MVGSALVRRLAREDVNDNIAIAANVMQAAHQNGVEKLMFLGSWVVCWSRFPAG